MVMESRRKYRKGMDGRRYALDSLIHTLVMLILPGLVDSRTYQLGVLMPTTGDWPIGETVAGAVTLAVNQVNTDPTLTSLRSQGHNVSFIWQDTACNQAYGLGVSVDMYVMTSSSNAPLDGIIGAACDEVCEPLASLAGYWELPMISYACSLPALSDKHRFPTFARTIPPKTSAAVVVNEILKMYGWERVGIVRSEEGVWHFTAESIQEFLESQNVTAYVVALPDLAHAEENHGEDEDEEEEEEEDGHEVTNSTHTEDDDAGAEPSILQEVQDAMQITRVYLLCVGSEEAVEVMKAASELGILDGEYVFLTIDISISSIPASSQSLFQGVLDISIRSHLNDPAFAPFVNDVITQSQLAPFFFDMTDKEVGSHAQSVYDAIYLFGLALNASLADGNAPDDIAAIATHLFYQSFMGMEGETFIDGNGDPNARYTVRNLQDTTWVAVIDYVAGINGAEDHYQETNASIIWPGGSTTPPLGRPVCGWEQEYCQEDATVMIVGCSIAAVLLLLFTLALWCYRVRRYNMEMMSMSWKIHPGDLEMHFSSRANTFMSSRLLSRQSMDSGSLEDQGQTFTMVARYQGNLVAVRKLDKDHVDLNSDVITEVNELRRLQHAHLNQFIGACVEPKQVMLVTQYCAKGSLQHILENDDIKLDLTFKVSFALDIAEGMNFLHGSWLGFHGRLKSSKVLIDNRWSCKLTDMGLWKFRQGELQRQDKTQEAMDYGRLWTAPELLRDFTMQGTPKSDVYSYGHILYHIVYRQPPFSDCSLEAKEILDKVANEQSNPPFRPLLEEDEEKSADFNDLIQLCWSEIPSLRPNFNSIIRTIKKISGGSKTNLVDSMIAMMEKYANQLEDIVAHRTKQLEEEKKKTEELLFRMLPRAVAMELKKGNSVEPESYECVTIFFSDIVGFTALAAASTPFQVVTFLNDLYTCFDNIIDSYDVYKVETIGDAYMVASGLPLRNEDRHVGEICTMALDLLSAVRYLKVAHQPDRVVQIRIGIHSGPAVAGVVGLKMPRYCLFGDTVNYASRMESSGLALRIHISPECKHLLDKVGGYHLQERGEVTMKGKGSITTYFLTGKDTFTKTLPDIGMAASMEEHEFK